MPAPVKDTSALPLRVENKLRARLEFLRSKMGVSTLNKFACDLLAFSADLLDNPCQCPPLPAEFIRLRNALHGRSGTYADEPPESGGRIAEEPTVMGNLQRDHDAMRTLDTMVNLLASKEAEIARLRALLDAREGKPEPLRHTA